MNRDKEQDRKDVELLNKIKDTRRTQGVDFEAPGNAFMVWADTANGPQYCGGATSLDGALKLAAQHVNMAKLYVVAANPPAISPFQSEASVETAARLLSA